MDESKTYPERSAKIREFVEELRALPFLSKGELEHLLDKYEAFLKKIYGDDCHQIRFLRRITFLSTAENPKEHLQQRIWYGGLNEVITLSNTLLEEYGDSDNAEAFIEYETEVEEEEEEDVEFFPNEEAAELARKIREADEEEAKKKSQLKEKPKPPETPADLKGFEQGIESFADVMTFILNGFIWFFKGIWKVLSRMIAQPEKLFKEWNQKIRSSMEYKALEDGEQGEAGAQE